MLAPTLCKPLALRAVFGLTEATGEEDAMVRNDPLLEGSARDLIASSHLRLRPEREADSEEDLLDDAGSQCDAIDAISTQERAMAKTIEQHISNANLRRHFEVGPACTVKTPLALIELQHRLGHDPTPSESPSASVKRGGAKREDEPKKELPSVPSIWPRRPALPKAKQFARSLRELSLRTGRVPSPREEKSIEVECEEIDLVGGNGAWQQRRAIAALERRLYEAEESKRITAERLARAKAKKELREKQRQREEIERSLRWNETLENQAMSILDAESRAWEEEEKRRLQEEERRRLAALQPKVCDLCDGSGLCKECDGQGTVHTLLLSAQVKATSSIVPNPKKSARNFGRLPWGCPTCCESSGVTPSEWVVGSGLCAQCDGVGKVFPTTPRRRRALNMTMQFAKIKSVKVVVEGNG